MNLRQELEGRAFTEQTPESFLVYADYLEESGDQIRADAARLTASVLQGGALNLCFADRAKLLELLEALAKREFQLGERQQEALVAIAENPGASTAGLANKLRIPSCSQTSLRDTLFRVQNKGLVRQHVRTRANGSACERKWHLTAKGSFLLLLASKMLKAEG